MAGINPRLTTTVEDYFEDLRRIRASGGGTGERSYYPPLTNLLNAVGGSLKPKVFCISELAQQGAGHPDLGLYGARQVQRGNRREGQAPEGGVVEVKPAGDDAWLTAESSQVSQYWDRYRLVLVTNTRDFVLLGEDGTGQPVKLETFRLADTAQAFESRLETPRAFARDTAPGLVEYLCRALSHRASLSEPKDLAWLLASYARDGLARVEAAGDAPSLRNVRSALEEALGVHFEGERGAAFFRSTLVQTLFYGVFSAWVLWARQTPPPAGRFNWHEAVWHLRAPVMRALFQQLADPGRLRPLGLVEVLDWTAAALDRVDRDIFFARFNEGEAVPYFYEPFLEAFDPALRKQLSPLSRPPRSLAGKPLAGFRATPSRRNPVLYGMVVYAIRFKNPLLHRQSTLRKRRLGENRVSGQTSSCEPNGQKLDRSVFQRLGTVHCTSLVCYSSTSLCFRCTRRPAQKWSRHTL